MNKAFSASLASILVLMHTFVAYSFEVGTHEQLSRRAVSFSQADNFLKTELNIFGGVDGFIAGKRIIDWVSREGSIREDDGVRFCNHFHNPLETWDQAGLALPFSIPFFCGAANHSSVLWGQSPALQPGGERFTWQDARGSFLQGLTGPTQAEREAQLARAFRALGQLIHWVQDAGVPAHTRNDPHPIFEGLESFVEDTRTLDPTVFDQLTNSSVGFDTTTLTLTPNPLAPIPIARIIDTTDPEQAEATPSAGTNIGMAEYSNGSFLSGDTIFKDFTFPRITSLGNPFDGTEPVTGRPRRYFPKVADGDTGFRLVATGTWTETLISIAAGDQGYILDGGVYTDYAGRLLPRAIGYSAGLLDYFFRGQLEIAPPDRFVYGRTSYREPFPAIDVHNNVNGFTRLAFKAHRND